MEITKAYLQKKFREYYVNAKFKVRNLEKREWAFVPLSAIPDFYMHRHMSFGSEKELKTNLIYKVPIHVYYSSAYYERPGEEKMEDKGWICADLIFDIDADHIPVKVDMVRALEIAKKEIYRLYRMLEKDFGVRDMEIVFSGNRGYHIHVHDKEFLDLESAERREIVNYFTLNRLSIESPQSTQKKRICTCATKLLYVRAKNSGNEKLVNKLKINMNNLYLCNLSNTNVKMSAKEKKLFIDAFLKCSEILKIHIDEPVTADTHRLIRLPNSLHGKTGFIVKPLKLEELEEFNPLKDALAFGSESVKVRCLKKAKVKVGEVNLKVRGGDKLKVPEYAAIYMICRGIALYGH